MAGQITHMEIAYSLAEIMGIDEGRAEFILGSIAPDAVPFTEPLRAEKIHTHLFENCGPWGDTQDYDQWLVNIKDFWDRYVKDEKDTRKKMFLLGICVHCLTDYWNDLMIWRVVQKRMMPPMNFEEFKAAYYPEAQRLGIWQFQNSPRAKEITELLLSSKEYDFEDYTKIADLKGIKDYLLNVQFNVPEKVDVSEHKYYTKDMLLDFTDEATRKVCVWLQAMENELYVKQLKPYLYLMDEGHHATGYIVVGDEKVCVIDTMNGFNDLHKVVRSITDKPIIVVNTHGHPDHIFGNIYFDEAYMNPKDLPLAESFIRSPEAIEFCRERDSSFPEFKPIKGGDVIDLGGKTLEVYDLPGHTPGGILLLLKEDRILFTGDSINHHLWMQLDGCLKLDDYVKELDKVLFLENEADLILHGHAQDFDDISLMRCLRNGIVEICDGKTENDLPYKWFGGVDKQHPFKLEEGKKYQQQESVICYR